MVEVTKADRETTRDVINALHLRAPCTDIIARHRTEATAALTAERDALAAIVEKYARHDGLCGIIGGYGYCTCGLDAARKALRDPT